MTNARLTAVVGKELSTNQRIPPWTSSMAFWFSSLEIRVMCSPAFPKRTS